MATFFSGQPTFGNQEILAVKALLLTDNGAGGTIIILFLITLLIVLTCSCLALV